MAVRQYIGARYVPIFTGDWSSQKTYEPLSIVSYQNNTYTSKVPVPTGILPTNEDYWALTGNYNGGISDLDTRVGDLEDSIGQMDKLTKLYKTNVVFVGDSYMVGVNTESKKGWNYYITQKLGCTDFNAYASGCGFVDNLGSAHMTFKEALSLLESEMTQDEKDNTSYVVCGGGYNDHPYTAGNQVYNAVVAFVDFARSKFKNAKMVVLGYGSPYRLTSNMLNCYTQISNGATDSGAMTAHDEIFRLLADDGFDSGDNVHPNDKGIKLIANDTISVMMGGTVTDNQFYDYSDLSPNFSVEWLFVTRNSGVVQVNGKILAKNADWAKGDPLFKLPWGCSTNTGTQFYDCYFYDSATNTNRQDWVIQMAANGGVLLPTSLPIEVSATMWIHFNFSYRSRLSQSAE